MTLLQGPKDPVLPSLIDIPEHLDWNNIEDMGEPTILVPWSIFSLKKSFFDLEDWNKINLAIEEILKDETFSLKKVPVCFSTTSKNEAQVEEARGKWWAASSFQQ